MSIDSSVPRDRELFEQALDRPVEEREAFLREACAGDEDLLRRVLDLLGVESMAGNFLGGPTFSAPLDSAEYREGDQIGRYRIVGRLGEGGFGVVYSAEQTEPVRRRVALKILKPGMDSRPIVARFAAERQALALMDHPSIARVFDAGATPEGRPYFVMELVPGLPLTQHCDEAKLTPRERLELFAEVCHALQHAHQKGIIHRDIKPSNVLVTHSDDRVVPKIIDFGIAKATQPDPETPAGITRGFELLGTPAYMSPEQARFSGADVDTRSDIYSLGVILHELLLGRTPFGSSDPQQDGFDAWRRRICEVDPLRASAVWRTLPRSEQVAVAARRATTPTGLQRELHGNLDWIVLKCLERDRARRYDSATALAEDIRRHLADETVDAAAPAMGYRLGKFLRRHRLAMGAATAVAFALVAGSVVSLSLAWRAMTAERSAQQLLEGEQRRRMEVESLRRRADDEAARARTEAATARAVTRFVTEDILATADPAREPERELTVRSVLDRASSRLEGSLTNEPAVAAALHETLGRAYLSLAMPAVAESHFQSAHELFTRTRGPIAEETLRAAIELAYSRHRSGPSTTALPLAESTTALARERFGRSHPMSIHCGNRLAWIYYQLARLDDWHREAEATYQDMQGVSDVEDADLLGVMYLVGRKRGRSRGGIFEAGEQILLHSAELMRERRGTEHQLTLRAKANLAAYYYDHWRHVDQAEALFLEVLDGQRRVLGESHENTLNTLRNLGLLYRRAERSADAVRIHLEILGLRPTDARMVAELPRLMAAAPLTPVLSPTGELTGHAAREEPPIQWVRPDFDDSTWEPRPEPSNGLGWWRATFDLSSAPSKPLVLGVAGVAHGEVQLNGEPCGSAFTTTNVAGHLMVSTPEATRALRAGRNVMTVKILQFLEGAPFRVTAHYCP